MNDILAGGWASYLWLFIAGFMVTAPWRAMGVYLARNLDIESELFKWVRAVSIALVAGLVARMVIFPSGALRSVASPLRLGAFLGGVAVYYVARRSFGLGILAAALLLLAGQVLLSGEFMSAIDLGW